MMTVRFLDICSDVFQPVALIHHLHHVTHDAYADGSTNAHRVEFWLIRRRIIFHVARRITRMAVIPTAAVTRNITERFSIEHREPITVPIFGGVF